MLLKVPASKRARMYTKEWWNRETKKIEKEQMGSYARLLQFYREQNTLNPKILKLPECRADKPSTL